MKFMIQNLYDLGQLKKWDVYVSDHLPLSKVLQKKL